MWQCTGGKAEKSPGCREGTILLVAGTPSRQKGTEGGTDTQKYQVHSGDTAARFRSFRKGKIIWKSWTQQQSLCVYKVWATSKKKLCPLLWSIDPRLSYFGIFPRSALFAWEVLPIIFLSQVTFTFYLMCHFLRCSLRTSASVQRRKWEEQDPVQWLWFSVPSKEPHVKDSQPIVLWGSGGSFKRWGLMRGLQVTKGLPLKGWGHLGVFLLLSDTRWIVLLCHALPAWHTVVTGPTDHSKAASQNLSSL